MKEEKIKSLFDGVSYIRTGGSPEELRAAEHLLSECRELGIKAWLEDFPVQMATIQEATLLADGREIPCKGYRNAGSAELEAPLYYLRSISDPALLENCRGKIVLVDGGMSYWVFHDLVDHGALGFITYDGDVNYADDDIDQKELRAFVSEGVKLPGVNINAKQAVARVRDGVQSVKLSLKQEEWEGNSRNVIAELPGETEEWIVLSAHYDSTSLSQGSYDNWSGSVGLLGIAEHFAGAKLRRGLRFVWCGSEERGLLGSKAYVAAHEDELKKIALNINLDMIGCIMGSFIACCSTEEKLVSYLEYFGRETDFSIRAYQDVYSSDSTPFADKGVPALSFARTSPRGTGTIHNRYDTIALMSMPQMAEDIDFLCAFTERMANAARCPVAREIPDSVKEKLDYYLNRKRRPQK